MTGCAIRRLLLLAALTSIAGCSGRETATGQTPIGENTALAARIEQLVETFLTSDDDARNASALSEARAIFEREGIPGVAEVGDAAAYEFVLINMLGQPSDFRRQFFATMEQAAVRHGLPEDALAFARARRQQLEIEERYTTHTPSLPQLRDEISGLVRDDQAVRKKEDFDRTKMEAMDRRIGRLLEAILNRYGVPTYDMVGVQAAKDFVVMAQHQPAEFRLALLPQLKANADMAQADPGMYATVYDRSQRDSGKNQLYGQQLECTAGKTLDVAPIDDAANVNGRRAGVGLMRLELYTRLVRLQSPDMCGSGGSSALELSGWRTGLRCTMYK